MKKLVATVAFVMAMLFVIEPAHARLLGRHRAQRHAVEAKCPADCRCGCKVVKAVVEAPAKVVKAAVSTACPGGKCRAK